MKLTKVSLGDLSDIQHEIAIPSDTVGSATFVCVTSVGTYRHGSAGAGDAAYIQAVAESAIRAWKARGVILDFIQLAYEWGDEMDDCFSLGPYPHFPVAVITGPDCVAAIRSLVPNEYSSLCASTVEDAIKIIEDKRSG